MNRSSDILFFKNGGFYKSTPSRTIICYGYSEKEKEILEAGYKEKLEHPAFFNPRKPEISLRSDTIRLRPRKSRLRDF